MSLVGRGSMECAVRAVPRCELKVSWCDQWQILKPCSSSPIWDNLIRCSACSRCPVINASRVINFADKRLRGRGWWAKYVFRCPKTRLRSQVVWYLSFWGLNRFMPLRQSFYASKKPSWLLSFPTSPGRMTANAERWELKVPLAAFVFVYKCCKKMITASVWVV